MRALEDEANSARAGGNGNEGMPGVQKPTTGFTRSRTTEHIPERPQETPLRRPIGNGERDIGKRTAEIIFQRLPKIRSRPLGIIGKGTTTPGPEHQRRVTVALGNRQDAMNTAL
jgi:hypothetical protein